jgi:hypothetical protein
LIICDNELNTNTINKNMDSINILITSWLQECLTYFNAKETNKQTTESPKIMVLMDIMLKKERPQSLQKFIRISFVITFDKSAFSFLF